MRTGKPLSETEVFKILVDAIHEVSPRTESQEITPESDLVLEIGLDSFEMVEALLLVESELDVTLELEDAMFEDINSAGQLAKRLAALLSVP